MSNKGKLAWGLVLALSLLHYDFWYWNTGSIVLGFMPIGLLYQALISAGSGLAWYLVVRHAWPSWIEEWAEGSDGDQP